MFLFKDNSTYQNFCSALSVHNKMKASGRSSGVEHQLPKLGVAGSNPVARSRSETFLNCCLSENFAPMSKKRIFTFQIEKP